MIYQYLYDKLRIIMNRYYIKDTTVNKLVYKQNIQEVVSYLEELCKRSNKKNRTDFMTDMISLGHGYDDPNGVYFTQLMADKFDIGVIKSDGSLKRCNIHEHARNAKYRAEMGD